jgi:hypothetical protein
VNAAVTAPHSGGHGQSGGHVTDPHPIYREFNFNQVVGASDQKLVRVRPMVPGNGTREDTLGFNARGETGRFDIQT